MLFIMFNTLKTLNIFKVYTLDLFYKIFFLPLFMFQDEVIKNYISKVLQDKGCSVVSK